MDVIYRIKRDQERDEMDHANSSKDKGDFHFHICKRIAGQYLGVPVPSIQLYKKNYIFLLSFTYSIRAPSLFS